MLSDAACFRNRKMQGQLARQRKLEAYAFDDDDDDDDNDDMHAIYTYMYCIRN